MYPVLLIVVATYYILFAVMGEVIRAVLPESLAAGVFVLVAAAGFKINPWFTAFGLAARGIFDLTHRHFIANPGVPS